MSDCIIIGGGLIGLLTARELSREGMHVLLLERGETGQESSWAGGGIISPLYPWRYPESVTALASWSQREYPLLAATLLDESGVDPEFLRSGLMVLDASEHDEARAWARIHGIELERISAADIPAIEPGVTSPDHDTLWFPNTGQIRNPRLVRAVRASLGKRVRIQENTEVEELIIDGNRVIGARTRGNSFHADRTLVCAGAWTGKLLADVGHTPDIAPVHGQMILLQTPPGLVSHIVLSEGHYVIPRKDGRVLSGSTLELTGFEKHTSKEAMEQLRQDAIGLFRDLSDCPIERHWSGLRPSSPAGIPYIGKHPKLEGLFINSGHFRNGLVLAPASCRLAADLILGRPPILDPAPYRMDAYRQ